MPKCQYFIQPLYIKQYQILLSHLMRTKNGFSPWRTKGDSIDVDEEEELYKNYTQQKKIIFDRNGETNMNNIMQRRPNSNITLKRKQDKNTIMNDMIARQPSQRFATIQKKRYSISSQRCMDQENDLSKKTFDNEKWKTLSHHSKDTFNQEYTKIKRQRFNYTKCRLLERNYEQSKQKEPKVALQQVAVRNFVIQGSYQSQQNQASITLFNLSKKKQSSFILKQKFAQLRKSMNVIKNKQNVFKVVKLQRQINKKLNTLQELNTLSAFNSSNALNTLNDQMRIR